MTGRSRPVLALLSALGLAATPVARAVAAYGYDGVDPLHQVALRSDADAVAERVGLSETDESRAGTSHDDDRPQLARASARPADKGSALWHAVTCAHLADALIDPEQASDWADAVQ